VVRAELASPIASPSKVQAEARAKPGTPAGGHTLQHMALRALRSRRRLAACTLHPTVSHVTLGAHLLSYSRLPFHIACTTFKVYYEMASPIQLDSY
jgi:hypothetical protein